METSDDQFCKSKAGMDATVSSANGPMDSLRHQWPEATARSCGQFVVCIPGRGCNVWRPEESEVVVTGTRWHRSGSQSHHLQKKSNFLHLCRSSWLLLWRLSLKFAQTTAYALAISEMVKFPADTSVLHYHDRADWWSRRCCRVFSNEGVVHWPRSLVLLHLPWRTLKGINGCKPASFWKRQAKQTYWTQRYNHLVCQKKSSNFRTVFLLVVSIQQHAWTTCLAWPRGTLWDQAWSIGSMWSLTAHWRTPHFLDAGLARNGWEYPRHHHLPQELVCQAFVILLVWFFARIRPGLTWNWLKCDAWRDLPQTVASLCSSYHGDGQCCCRLEFEATGIPNGGPAMGVFYCINNTDKYILVCYIYIIHIHTEI